MMIKTMTGQGWFFTVQARIEIGRLLGNVITFKQVQEYSFSGMVKTDDDLQGICEWDSSQSSGKPGREGFQHSCQKPLDNHSQHSLPDISTKHLQYNEDRLNNNKQPRLNNIKAKRWALGTQCLQWLIFYFLLYLDQSSVMLLFPTFPWTLLICRLEQAPKKKKKKEGGTCYGLNVSLLSPTQFIYWNPRLKCGDLRR